MSGSSEKINVHTLFGFLAEFVAGLGDILYLARFLSYLDEENTLFAGLSGVGIALGVAIAVAASVGTAKSHFELNKYFDGTETSENGKKIGTKEKMGLFFNLIGYGINFSSPIGSGMRKASTDFNIKISEPINFAVNTGLLVMGSLFGLGDAQACKNAMIQKEYEPKKTDKLSLFSALGRIPGAVSYFYFSFLFFQLWGKVVSENANSNVRNALTDIIPMILGVSTALFATVGTTVSRYRLYNHCAKGFLHHGAEQEEVKGLDRLDKAALAGSLLADTLDIASSLVFNAELLAFYIVGKNKNPLTQYQELFGLFLPLLLISVEGAAANFRTTKTAFLNEKHEEVMLPSYQQRLIGDDHSINGGEERYPSDGAGSYRSPCLSPMPEMV